MAKIMADAVRDPLGRGPVREAFTRVREFPAGARSGVPRDARAT